MSDRMSEKMGCAFCGKTSKETEYLIAGPYAFICDLCVCVCMEIVHEKRSAKAGAKQLADIRENGT